MPHYLSPEMYEAYASAKGVALAIVQRACEAKIEFAMQNPCEPSGDIAAHVGRAFDVYECAKKPSPLMAEIVVVHLHALGFKW